MNFQDLKTVEKPQFYIDLAFKKGNKRADQVFDSFKSKKDIEQITRIKVTELEKIQEMTKVANDHFYKILKIFPQIDNLEEFYYQLIKLTLDYEKLKKSLGALNWVVQRLEDLEKKYLELIRKTHDHTKLKKLKNEFIGRFTSFIKQIKDELQYLEDARKVMRGFPSIKKMFTVCIAGFPNIGKSTLLSKITTAKPEIQDYAFTTKKINAGYIKDAIQNIQILDTPGSLDRFNKMNDIEKWAYLALKHTSNLILYIFDLTETYSIEDQKKLYENLKDLKKDTIVYLTKTDIIDKKVIEKFKKDNKSLNVIDNQEDLLKELRSRYIKYVTKDKPKSKFKK